MALLILFVSLYFQLRHKPYIALRELRVVMAHHEKLLSRLDSSFSAQRDVLELAKHRRAVVWYRRRERFHNRCVRFCGPTCAQCWCMLPDAPVREGNRRAKAPGLHPAPEQRFTIPCSAKECNICWASCRQQWCRPNALCLCVSRLHTKFLYLTSIQYNVLETTTLCCSILVLLAGLVFYGATESGPESAFGEGTMGIQVITYLVVILVSVPSAVFCIIIARAVSQAIRAGSRMNVQKQHRGTSTALTSSRYSRLLEKRTILTLRLRGYPFQSLLPLIHPEDGFELYKAEVANGMRAKRQTRGDCVRNCIGGCLPVAGTGAPGEDETKLRAQYDKHLNQSEAILRTQRLVSPGTSSWSRAWQQACILHAKLFEDGVANLERSKKKKKFGFFSRNRKKTQKKLYGTPNTQQTFTDSDFGAGFDTHSLNPLASGLHAKFGRQNENKANSRVRAVTTVNPLGSLNKSM